MITVRASSLGRFLLCPRSIDPPLVEIFREDDRPARIGDAVHDSLEALVKTGSPVDLMVFAQRNHVTVDEIAPKYYAGRNMWLDHFLPLVGPDATIQTEIAVEYTPMEFGETIKITGHPDVLITQGHESIVIDWKTGRADEDHTDQIRAYMAAALLGNPIGTRARGYVASLTLGTIDALEMSREDLQAFDKQLLDAAQDHASGKEQAGEHCTYCPRRNECKTRAEWIGASLAVIDKAQTWDLAQYSPEKLLEIWERAGAVEKAAEMAKEMIRILAKGGSVPWLVREEKNVRDADPAKTIAVADGLGIDSAIALKVSLPALEKAARQAGKAREFATALEASGAVTVTTRGEWRRDKKWTP